MKISITLITSNRKDDIINTINQYYKQDYEDFEIILIDNGSNDGTKEAVPVLFPDVKYIYLMENFAMKAMNFAFSLADGDIFWRGDDDSFPESTDCLSKVADIFKNNPNIDIIASEDIEMRIGGQIYNWYGKEVDKVNIPDSGYIATHFHGTGVGIRREVWEKIGGFWGWGYEEMDFSIRALNEGFNIRYFPNIRVLHYSAVESRRTSWRWLKFYLKIIEFSWKYYPFFTAFSKSILITTNQLLQGIYQRIPILTLIEGVLSALPLAMQTRRESRIILKPEVLDIAKNKISFKSYWNFYSFTIKNKLRKKK